MEKEFDKIIEEFKKLNMKGYIKGINNNLCNSVGLTFENQCYLLQINHNIYNSNIRQSHKKLT